MPVAASPPVSSGLLTTPELPIHLTRFIGRGRELDELVEVARSSRLLTLTGAGGSGKTRLAREAASRLAGSFERVAWADLAPLSHRDLLYPRVAGALDIGERAGADPRDLVVQALGAKRVLLVLDNCEHLVDGCAELVDTLLRACPGLSVLTTSREALAVGGETAWLVPPMVDGEAEELFFDRAQAALPSFAFDAEDTAAVGEICRRLDRIPLAIELAAARIRVLPPKQIARRLDDAFQLLSGTTRGGLARHRTLRATMDWSFRLLEDHEKVLLRRLSVFAGGFTLDAAESVCAGPPLTPNDILDGVSMLVEKSLVVMESSHGDARYRLLETVRQYGLERMEEAGDREAVEERFARHFLALLERAEPRLIGGSNSPKVLARVTAEIDNLRAAAAWALEAPSRVELALRLVGAGFWVCYALGLFREMRLVADQALALTGPCAAHIRGRALVASGLTALAQGDYSRSCAELEAALPFLREAGDDRATAVTLAKQGAARLLSGDHNGALSLLEEALAFTQGWPEQEPGVVFARFWRSWAAYESGQLDRAYELMAANARVARDHGLPTTRGHAAAALGRIELARGNVDSARRWAAEALDLEVKIDDAWGIGLALDLIAALSAHRGRWEKALRLLAGTEAHRARIALAIPGPTPDDRRGLLDTLRTVAGDQFDSIYAEGLSLSTVQLIEVARAEITLATPAGIIPSACEAHAARGNTGRLGVSALGALLFTLDGLPIEPSAWGSARSRELLVHLLMHPQGRTKEQIGLAFWPDASSAQLRNNFHVTLHRLRKSLGGAEWITLEGERYHVKSEVIDFDGLRFEKEVAAALTQLRRQADGAQEELEQAISPYRGDFLEGEPFGDWVLAHRDHLRGIYLGGLMTLGTYHMRHENYEVAVDAFRRMLITDELHEEALRALLVALDALGERSRALQLYHRFRDRLRAELGAEPSRETTTLARRLAEGT